MREAKEQTLADQDTSSPASNMEKADGDRRSEWGEGTSEGAGQPIRPVPDTDNMAGGDRPVMPDNGATPNTKI